MWVRFDEQGQINGNAIGRPIDAETGIPIEGWEEIEESDPLYLEWIANGPARPAMPDWDGLVSRLRGTAIFGKALTGNPNLFTVLNSALTVTRNLQDFEWSLANLRPTMAADFTAEEIAQVNTWLEECDFELRIN